MELHRRPPSVTKGPTEHAVPIENDDTRRASTPRNKRRRKRHSRGITARPDGLVRGRAVIDEFYHPLSKQDRMKQTTLNFKAERLLTAKRRRQAERIREQASRQAASAMHQDERTFRLVTQNVNGFGSTAAARDAWFQSFRTTDSHGCQDVILLQETHVERSEVSSAENDHATRWGFRSGRGSRCLSYWAPSRGKKRRCRGARQSVWWIHKRTRHLTSWL